MNVPRRDIAYYEKRDCDSLKWFVGHKDMEELLLKKCPCNNFRFLKEKGLKNACRNEKMRKAVEEIRRKGDDF